MGQSASTQAVQKATTDLTEIVSKSMISCEVNSKQKQSAVRNNSGFVLSQSTNMQQTTTINSSCFSDITKQTEIQNKITDYFKQNASATGSGSLLPSSNSAVNKTNIANVIKNNVTMENIQKQFNLIKQNQSATTNNSGVILIDSVNMTQGAQVFAAATMKVLDNAGVFNAIETHAEQTASSTTLGMFGGFTYVIYGILILIGLGIALRFFRNSSTNPNDPMSLSNIALSGLANRMSYTPPQQQYSQFPQQQYSQPPPQQQFMPPQQQFMPPQQQFIPPQQYSQPPPQQQFMPPQQQLPPRIQ